MICFERGKDPKETMGIGAIANALEIENIIYAQRRPIMSHHDPTMKWSMDFETEYSPSHCMTVLLGIQAGELNPEEHAVSHYEPGPVNLTLTMMSDLLGTYVIYRGETYKIPTLDEIRKMRESRKDNGIGNLRLH